MNIIKKLYKSISKGVTDWHNDPAKRCNNCEYKFFLYNEVLYCDTCSREICQKCKIEPYYAYKKHVCADCHRKNLDNINNFIIVKSEHIGGHNILQTFSEITSDFEARDSEESTDNLKYKATKLGGNGIVSFQSIRNQYAKTTPNKGTYYFSLFSSKGKPVLVEKKNQK